MKKKLFPTTLLLFLFLLGIAFFSFESNAASVSMKKISVHINNKTSSVKVLSCFYQTQRYSSASQLFKAINAKYSYNKNTGKLLVTYKNKKYTLFLNKKVMYANGSRISISAPPKIINGIVTVPKCALDKITSTQTSFSIKNNTLYIGKQPAPTSSKLSKAIVVIDPGHGGKQKGASYGGIHEKDLNLDVSLKLYKMLKNKGIKTYMTRSTDKFVSLSERSAYANKLGATLFISIHHNALPNRSSYSGTETLYSPHSPLKNKLSSKKLASIVQNSLVSRLNTVSRGIISRSKLAVLRNTKMPSIIAEIGYMTNAKERKKMTTNSFKQKAAEGLCSAVVKALNQ